MLNSAVHRAVAPVSLELRARQFQSMPLLLVIETSGSEQTLGSAVATRHHQFRKGGGEGGGTYLHGQHVDQTGEPGRHLRQHLLLPSVAAHTHVQ